MARRPDGNGEGLFSGGSIMFMPQHVHQNLVARRRLSNCFAIHSHSRYRDTVHFEQRIAILQSCCSRISVYKTEDIAPSSTAGQLDLRDEKRPDYGRLAKPLGK